MDAAARQNGTATRGRAWTKKAIAADAGTLVIVTSSGIIKSAMSVAAYRSNPRHLRGHRLGQTAGTTSTTNHITPAVAVAQPGSWLVNSWSEKSSTVTTWTKPATSTTRTTPIGTGTRQGELPARRLRRPVATGTAAAAPHTTSIAGGGTQLFSVVISPGTDTTPPATRRRCPPSPPPAPP